MIDPRAGRARVRHVHRAVAAAAPCSSPTPRCTSCRPRRSWPTSPSQTAAVARQLGHEPRVALLSFSTFGNPPREKAERVRDAVDDARPRGRGSISNTTARCRPMSRSTPADARALSVLPPVRAGQRADHAGAARANISAKLLQQLGGGAVIGPMLIGMDKPVQIVQPGATVSDIVTAAALAAFDARR